jgi:guanosine-3',5'-bis(diphosphate) 3'-pyrophosphohydrolase
MRNPGSASSVLSSAGPDAPKAAGSVAKENAASASFDRLLHKLAYLSENDVELVRDAYRFADQAHLGQLRNSGEPYITHPIAVAAQCAEWKLDAQALMAALLHDAMEDCGITKVDLLERYGPSVAELVDGLTKLDKLNFNTREENQAESFRKMLLAMARDVRVILIKLADRTHNMRTLSDSPASKWPRIARETLDIYAPIAHRLGLNQTYRELQDLSFKHLKPWRYATIDKALSKARSRRRDLIRKVQSDLEALFAQNNLKATISGREKSVYSIYKKMTEKSLSFAQVTDIFGFRVIVPHLIECYTALGLLHQLYKPVPGKFKDHIAISKVNGYQSLHTTLVGPSGVNVEFQLRTPSMHMVAESGIAAHWLYKEPGSGSEAPDDRLSSNWMQSLLDIQNETRDATEFWDHVKVDLYPDAVYVFTPKSQILSLPRGATVIDFAYAIHSNVGDHTVSVRVNNEDAPLRTELKNGDVVEVFTDPKSKPKPAWLGFAKTARARSKIRQHLKTMAHAESEAMGIRMLTLALRAEGIQNLPGDDETSAAIWDKLLRFSGNRTRSDLLVDIGLGKRIASIVAKRVLQLSVEAGLRPDSMLISREHLAGEEESQEVEVTVDGSEGSSVQFGTCCRPVPGDTVIGYLGHGEGLTVHTTDCVTVRKLEKKHSERFIAVDWSDEPTRSFETGIVVTVNNGKGVLAKVAGVLASGEVDITHIDMPDVASKGPIDLSFLIEVRNLKHLDTVLKTLRHSPVVIKALRTKDANAPSYWKLEGS